VRAQVTSVPLPNRIYGVFDRLAPPWSGRIDHKCANRSGQRADFGAAFVNFESRTDQQSMTERGLRCNRPVKRAWQQG
jgi:hypothetical protein